MKIGELAHVAQCTVETVRYYETDGLLPAPARRAANYRSYGSELTIVTKNSAFPENRQILTAEMLYFINH